MVPTQLGPRGMRYDFNAGARMVMPDNGTPWHVRMRDLDTGNTLFETTLAGGTVTSTKRYYIRFELQVSQGGEVLMRHEFDPRGRHVLIVFPVETLGDTIGWFPYAVKYQRQYGCRLTVAMTGRLIPLFRDAYPEITFITEDQIEPDKFYASYNVCLYFNDDTHIFQPIHYHLVGLHRNAGYMLGVDPTEERPKLGVPDEGRPMAEPYVVIATQSTAQSKYWNNPTGWHEVIEFLKASGLRVVCIDQKRVNGQGLVWNHTPHGVQDETGDRPITERVRWLRHAEFFVGLSSGLSWLAWATGVPVVMIAGITLPLNEFSTEFRIINYHACYGCWNDMRIPFVKDNFMWCPRHADTPRQFECTKLITAEQVMNTIRKVPAFQRHMAGRGG